MKKKIISIIIILIILTFSIIALILNKKGKTYEITYNNNYAFFYQDDNGEYKKSDEIKWNNGEFILNKENSFCDGVKNPDFLSWNNSNNMVVLKRNKAVKCNLYFDKKNSSIFDKCPGSTNLVDCFNNLDLSIVVDENNKTDSCPNGIGGIIKHDGTLGNDAGDNGYRYSGCNPNNYICFGNGSENYNLGISDVCPTQNKYRIIGYVPVTVEGQTKNLIKVIKAEYLTEVELEETKVGIAFVEESYKNLKRTELELNDIPSYKWNDDNNTWNQSGLFTLLNSNKYINKAFGDIWKDKIETVTWNVGGSDLFEVTSKVMYDIEANGQGKEKTVEAQIGLIYNYDYGFTSDKNNWQFTLNSYSNTGNTNNNRESNWLFNGLHEWTISPVSSGTTDAFRISGSGYLGSSSVSGVHSAVRPSFYLKSSVKILGDAKVNGSVSNPFKIQMIYDYDYKPEAQEFVAPIEGDYKIELWGASGGTASEYKPGYGAYTTGIIHLDKNEKMYIYTGEQGKSSNLAYAYEPTFNGGGGIGFIRADYTSGPFGGSGGGATDIRIIKGTSWNDFDSLKSRIMVAAGGGAAGSRGGNFGDGNGGDGGTLVGLTGQNINNAMSDTGYGIGYGGSQTNPGKATWILGTTNSNLPQTNPNFNPDLTVGGFGYAGIIHGTDCYLSVCPERNNLNWVQWGNQTGGGGGYYGGASTLHGGAGGGSSYISGYQGCVAISNSSTQGNVIPKDNCTEDNAKNNIECSYHYSRKIFTNPDMKAGNEVMPSPNRETETGHIGNGYARITLIN